jgi:HAD superfamily hydrolase (TIGR01509 family)
MSTPQIPLPDAIVFDFDGTILDTETPEYQSWVEIFTEYRVELPLETWTACIGLGAAAIKFDPYACLEESLRRRVNRSLIRQRRRARFYELLALQEPRPGIVAWLKAARAQDIPLAIASSSDRDWVVGHLKRLGLRDYFMLLRCADDVTHTKPHPELYLTACAALNARPAHSIAIEDSPNGLRAAKSAGMFVVACPNPMTASLSFDAPDLYLSTAESLSLETLIQHAANRSQAAAGQGTR